jgi:hypothetical protein
MQIPPGGRGGKLCSHLSEIISEYFKLKGINLNTKTSMKLLTVLLECRGSFYGGTLRRVR